MRCGMMKSWAYLREGTVVPEVAFVWEAVANEAEFAFLDVLLNGVEGLLFGDLSDSCVSHYLFWNCARCVEAIGLQV